MRHTAVVSTASPTQSSPPRLQGNLGTLGLFFSVMSYNAPLVVVVGVIPLMVTSGNGIGTPLVLLLAGIILAAFADGFIQMSKTLPRPGAFYSFVTVGLGKTSGLGAGLVMLVAYFCVTVGTVAFGGIVLQSLVTDTLGGPDLPWALWSMVFWAATAVLGYLRVDLSAKVLTGVLILELLVVAAYDIGVVWHGAGHGRLSTQPWSPHHLMDGSLPIGLLFAMGLFGGFEVSVLLRDELKNPQRSIPLATFGVIASAAALYSVTSWLLVSSVGVDDAVAKVTADPIGTMNGSIAQFAGTFVLDASTVLVNTSTFAVLLCAHNVTSRYAFNLGADGILPSRLSAAHPRHGSPHVASLVVSALSLVAFGVVVATRVDPHQFYGASTGMAALGGTIVFLLTSCAVVRYLNRPGSRVPLLRRAVLPAIACLGLGVSLLLTLTHFSVLTGGSELLSTALMGLIVIPFVVGVVLARRYRRTRPDVYRRIGRE
ncbi:APC family permease [Streptomyces sp. NPDC000151]|uniref:APC family permease n=1 Tax=Streptomyces sp. NPDC000151 TaxID=3154244 RepID=UPI0033165485